MSHLWYQKQTQKLNKMPHEMKQWYTVKRNGQPLKNYYAQSIWAAEMMAWNEFKGRRNEYKATLIRGRK